MTEPEPHEKATSSELRKPVYIVMGVTGSGKTTIGKLLAKHVGLPFYDADDFHTMQNLKKLANDIPLDDADREPWLQSLADKISEWSRKDGAVLACSALKHSYRSRFRHASPSVHFVYLTGDPRLIAQRLVKRATEGGHVVKDFDQILRGQYRDLEIPSSALQVDITPTPDVIVDNIIGEIQQRGLGDRTIHQ